MLRILLCLFVCLYMVSPIAGWGYIFRKFRPESNGWGYGGAGLGTQRASPREQLMESLLAQELLQEEEEVCDGRRCTSNDHCCRSYVCAQFDSAAGGTCVSPAAPEGGAECSSSLDCEQGLVCELGVCAQVGAKKGYNEECQESQECDGSRGLCCQVVRGHRMAPRKLCSYYRDALDCIGQVGGARKRRPAN